MEWLGLMLVLGAFVGVMPAVREQYRRDRAGFWKTLRLLAIFFIYVIAGFGLVVPLFVEPQPEAKAIAITAFLVAWIFYGALWLTRVVPRYRELPAFVDKFPGALDFAFWAVMAAALAYGIFG
jgi:FtsH-binding integral membrane protein